MDIPKNCEECLYTNICPAPHYGGDGCKHEEEINRERIEALLPGKPKE